jgi:hypothetical protein
MVLHLWESRSLPSFLNSGSLRAGVFFSIFPFTGKFILLFSVYPSKTNLMWQENNLNNLRENSFFFSLLLFVILLPFSEASVSITSGLLLMQALLLKSWKHPSFSIIRLKSLLLISSIFLLYLLWTILTEDVRFALYEWRKVIFWIIIPPAFFLSPKLSGNRFILLLALFCLSVFAASLFGVFRLILSDFFHITDFRKIILISHIRFSFQIVLAIIVLSWFLLADIKIPAAGIRPVWILALLVWFMWFLLLLKSITGIAAFTGILLVFILYLVLHIRKLKWRVLFLIAFFLVLLTPLLYVGHVWYSFYHSETLDQETVDKFTSSGNPYSFDFSSKERENGHWVRAYICEPEMRKEWNRVSSCPYDSLDKNGFPYSATLVRYLTSKGFRKDSAGVNQLSPKDIRAVENGLANHIFVDNSFSIYPRIYQTIWELDVYFRLGDPNFQSVSQRLEFVKASLILIREHPLTGIGTGNWKIKYAEAYRKMNSKLFPENQGPSHNQYLNYLVKFGIVGFLYIIFALLMPVFREKHHKNLFFWLFLLLIGIVNLGDANLETHMGLSFFTFFYCLFLWHSPEDLRQFHL